ncbi:MAG: VCBS repeat-containing protein [Acidobacteria bacterium]|nr:VCBS repeat-containing protein [Acidobacteriota bacterium]MBV9071426.1 VCBS repeat-containing protein [Acidobacteriota bacterium]MBV9187737.1 VCBS repeat-containing protein [Acidobacteriota bacterium]
MKRHWLLITIFSFVAAEAMAADCSWTGFRAPVRYASTANRALLVRDLDGDGAPEIIASGNQVDELPAFSILPNRGDGTFAAERLIPTGFGETLQDVGDLDHDGIPDLLVSNYWANGIAVFRGEGGLQFDGGTSYGTATHGGPSLIADYDHDGTPDVISLSFGSGNPVRIHRFRGLVGVELGPKTTFDTQLANGDWPSARMINGALEVLVSEHLRQLAILRFANDGVTVSTIAAGPGIDRSSTFADVNGDGIADIIDTNDIESANEPVFVTLANADGTFQTRRQLAHARTISFSVQLRVRDLDGDGHPDIIVSDLLSTSLHVYRGNGSGDFAEGITIDAGGPVNVFDVADVNGDGYLDIVTANNDHTVSVLVNRGPCPPSRHRAAKH